MQKHKWFRSCCMRILYQSQDNRIGNAVGSMPRKRRGVASLPCSCLHAFPILTVPLRSVGIILANSFTLCLRRSCTRCTIMGSRTYCSSDQLLQKLLYSPKLEDPSQIVKVLGNLLWVLIITQLNWNFQFVRLFQSRT
jgi:hypothetical protein